MTAAAPRTGHSQPRAHFLSLLTWTRDDLESILARARDILDSAGRVSPLAGKKVHLLWTTRDDRTRQDFSSALENAGCHRQLIFRLPAQEGWNRLADGDVLVCRLEEHWRMSVLRRSSGAPIVNAGTSSSSPYRVLAEIFGLGRLGVDLDSAEIAWVGDPGPRLNSWLEATVRFGFSLDVRIPPGCVTDPALTAYAGARARGILRLGGSLADPISAPVVLFSGDTGYNSLTKTGKVACVGPECAPPWRPEGDAAVALGILEEVWVRTARARTGEQ